MLGVDRAMRYLPILVDLAGRACLVVGAGAIGARKVEQLLAAGARVTVVATRIGTRVTELAAASPSVRVEQRAYRPEDLDGIALAFAATDDPALQEAIAVQARAAGGWLNAGDEPERGIFVRPAVVDRDPLVVAVSTSGASPALARRIRDDLDETLGPEYAAAVDTLAKLRGRYAPGPRRQAAFLRIVDGGLLDALRGGDGRRVDELIAAACTGLPEQAAAGGTR